MRGVWAIGQSNAGTQILTTKISVTIKPILNKLETKNYHPKATHHAKVHLNVTMWVVWMNTVPSLPLFGFFVFLFFGFLVTRTGRINGSILTIYASYNEFSCKDVPFGGCIDTAPHLGSQIVQKPQFWGRE